MTPDLIPCLVLTHGRDEINRASLQSIIDCDPRLDLDVVHNPSVAEDGRFIAFAQECVADGRIRSFTLFDENISNNAVLLVLLESLDRYRADRVVITDGDIVAPPGLIDEELSILDKHSDVLACGLRLDASAWDDSLVIKRDFVDRFNTTQFEREDYVDTATGMWMAMFRGPELAALIETLRDNGVRLTDANLKQVAAALFQKQWVATKASIGRELNRERPDYHDTKAVSTKGFADHSPEPAGSRYSTWNHDWVVPATRWSETGQERVTFPALPPALPRFRGPLDEDPVVKELTGGTLSYDFGYLANHLMRATRPGLALIVSQGRCPPGLMHLGADRSALFLSPHHEEGGHITNLKELDCGPILIGLDADACLQLLPTIDRFIAQDALVHGLVFVAESIRKEFLANSPTAMMHIPTHLRRLAQDALKQSSASAIDELTECLWTDETLRSWVGAAETPIELSHSVKVPHLAYFRVKRCRQ